MTRQKKFSRLFFISILLFGTALVGTSFAQEAGQQPAQATPGAAGQFEFEGTVKIGLGNYFYLPSAKGFDVVVQGTIEGQDASTLVGKDIRVKGTMLQDEPSVLVADTIEIKEGGQYRNVFTRTSEVALQDHLDAKERAEFQALTITGIDKADQWEGKGKVKIKGKLENEKAIVISDDKGKQIGTILVDSRTTYADYYIKKLPLFDEFWFYLSVKDTVDAKVRRKSRELFHADLVFAGLY
jgi:hypothetical protein